MDLACPICTFTFGDCLAASATAIATAFAKAAGATAGK